MKNWKNHSKLSIIVAVVLSVLLIGTVAYAVSYQLNKTVPATVTITESPPTQATLYTDLLCTTEFTGTLNFGTVNTSGMPFVTVYVRTSEIAVGTINVTSDIDTSKATIGFIVGTPSSANSYKGVPVVIMLTPVAPAGGTMDFHVTVTGNS